MTHDTPPPTLVDDLHRLTARELALPTRMPYVVLLLAASAMTAIVAALLLTEPALPARTTIALSVLTAMGVSWMVFAAWVLTKRRTLLANHRIVASRLATTFSGVFCIGALAVAFATTSAAALAAAAMGLVMLVVAVAMWVRARRRFEQLSRRRHELERQIQRSGQ